MKARVVCLASAKGGSGKTMLTATFANFLADLGLRVLMIDTDAATNGLSLFYLKNIVEAEQGAVRPRGLFELTSASAEPAVTRVRENLDLLPATYGFRNTESTPVGEYTEALASTVEKLRESYDFIFLDAQAGSDEYAQVAVSARLSDQVIIVSEYDPMSAAGVERLKALFGEDLGYFRTWVLLNKMLPDFVKSFSEFLEIAKYASPIPWDADVVRAYARRSLALDSKRGNEHTLAVIQSMRSLFGEAIGDRLDNWLEDHAEEIREPIRKQVEELENELLALNEASLRRRQLTTLTGFARRSSLVAFGAAGTGLAVAQLTLHKFVLATTIAYTALLLVGIVFVWYEMLRITRPTTARNEDRQRDLERRIGRLTDLERLSPEAIIRRQRASERP
jgi:cellulose biosynthesis protein BcsQ